MKIKNISWINYKGLKGGSICADGNDVVISGRNGAGKSSIASMIPFVLFGKVSGSLNRYENGLTKHEGLIHGAEIIFEDGTTFRRELHESGRNSVTKLFINGEVVKKNQFDAQVMSMTAGGGELVMNPFAFCEMSAKDQRAFLLKKFSSVSERDLPEYAQLADVLRGRSPATFIAECRERLRRLHADLKTIPARLEEINRQGTSETSTDEAELAAEIERLNEELKQIRQPQKDTAREELMDARDAVNLLNCSIKSKELELRTATERREELLKQYYDLQNAKPGICPMCGQTIPKDVFMQKRDAQLKKIVFEGKQIAAQIVELKRTLSTKRAKLEEKQKLAAELVAAVKQAEKKYSANFSRFSEIQEQLGELKQQQAALKRESANRERIIELKSREKELNCIIAELEGNIACAEKLQIDLMTATEAEINRQFKEVKFKLFDYLKTTGEIKPTCEATLHGVPYSSLSKGEQLRAALDVFAALQKIFNVKLPLIVDNAESYSALTLASLPDNQIFAFKVTDGELKIEVIEGEIAA